MAKAGALIGRNVIYLHLKEESVDYRKAFYDTEKDDIERKQVYDLRYGACPKYVTHSDFENHFSMSRTTTCKQTLPHLGRQLLPDCFVLMSIFHCYFNLC